MCRFVVSHAFESFSRETFAEAVAAAHAIAGRYAAGLVVTVVDLKPSAGEACRWRVTRSECCPILFSPLPLPRVSGVSVSRSVAVAVVLLFACCCSFSFAAQPAGFDSSYTVVGTSLSGPFDELFTWSDTSSAWVSDDFRLFPSVDGSTIYDVSLRPLSAGSAIATFNFSTPGVYGLGPDFGSWSNGTGSVTSYFSGSAPVVPEPTGIAALFAGFSGFFLRRPRRS